MPIPKLFKDKLSLPVICAPMFLVSSPRLIISACKNGFIGAFPALNIRPHPLLNDWLTHIRKKLEDYVAIHPDKPVASFGVNQVVHPSNSRLVADQDLIRNHKVPFVITSQGNPKDIVEDVHSWRGIVFHDVTFAYHAKKAITAGVDGIIVVAGGAGGHAGTDNPFALVREIREFWSAPFALAGAISDGYGIRAAEILGADFAYIGTRFIATEEAEVALDYKNMLVESRIRDHIYTDAFTGVNCNNLRPSLKKAVIDLDLGNSNAWKDIWSAGHGVSGIKDVLSMSSLAKKLLDEYYDAVKKESFL